MRINLMPPPPPVFRTRVWFFTLIIAVALAATAYDATIWISNRQAISGQKTLITEQENQLAAMVAEWSKLQGEQAGAKLVEQMNAIRHGKNRASVGLLAVLRDLPSNSIITALTYSSGDLSLTVTVPSLAKAATTIHAIQSDKSFSSASVTSVQTGGAAGASVGTNVSMILQLPIGTVGGTP